MDTRGRIRVGIGGWTYEPWRGTFYPEGLPQKRELEYASRQLTSIEINGTYYRLQKPESFEKWREETPEDFVFSLKAPRYVTNRKMLAEAGEAIERFLNSGLLLLGDKLGPINWQFMANKQFDPEDFEAFLKLLPPSHESRPLRHAVEVRHESFRVPEFVELLRTYGIAAVISSEGEFPQIADPTADFIYARIMGTREDEPLGYSSAMLESWAEKLRIWAAGGLPEGLAYLGPKASSEARDVYLYVISGHKVRNPQAARALIARL